MEEDDEDSDCLLIDEDRTEPEQPVNANSCQLNDTTSIANNEEAIRNNADTSPSNIVSLLKNFNLERFRNNNPHIFDDSNEETQKIEQGNKQSKSNGARVFCKDFSRIPFDNGNLLTPEYLASSELYAHLIDRNHGMSNFRPTANNFTNNAGRASDTFIQIPNPTEPYYRVPQLPPNTVNGKSDPKTGSVNTNRPDAIGNASTSIPLNRNGYGIRSENMTIGPAAEYLSHPGPANGAEVSSNVDRINGWILNNCLPPAMNMDSYGPVSIRPRQSQELYASDANRRQMYGHDLAAPSANYSPNTGRCQCACCTGSCALNTVTPTSVLPTNYISNRRRTCPESCNLHRSGPLYAAHPNIQAPTNFPTSAPRNPYSQAHNGNGAISREGLYRVEDPITYANYQQAYLAEMRRYSNVARQSTINTTRQHTVNIPGPAMNQKPKATNATRSCAKFNTNHINSGVINVAGFSAISASHQEATRCGNNSNMITNSEAFGIKNTVKNKRATKTIKKTPEAKTKVINKTPRGRPPKSKKNHLQLNNMNIATTLAHKQNFNLQEPNVEMRIPTEYGEIKLAYNRSNANIMPAPLSNELHLQNNMHNDIDQPQVNKTMQTIEQIIMDAVDMAMQNNVQQENVTMYGKVQTSMSAEMYKQDTLKTNVDSSVVLSNLNKSGAFTNETLSSEPVVSASAKGFELREPASFTGVEIIRDEIESIDLISDSDTRHNKMSMNINKVQSPNTQQSEKNINSEYAQIPLIMEACPQQAEMSLNTDKAQFNINSSKTQQANINMTSNRVKTIISKEVYTTQQDDMYTNVEPALASYMNNCEALPSVPQISRAANQASNACELEMPTSTGAKDITMNKDRAELESRTNISNAYTGTPLDRMTTNKAQVTIESEYSKITNNENSKMLTNAFQEDKKAEVLIITANPQKDIKNHTIQPAISDTIDMTMSTNLNQVKMCTNTETIPTLISTEANVQPANMNNNVESLQPPAQLNKNNLETQVTAPWNSEMTIQQSNTCELKVPAISSTVKEDAGLYIYKTELQSMPNITMKNNIQQNIMGSRTETVQTSISMETCTQQTSNNTYINNVLPLLTCVTQTSNTCNLTYTTSSIESVTNNVENTVIASTFNNLNPRTELISSVPRSDTIYDTTQTQAIVQHHETDQTVDHIPIDLLKSILHNVHRNTTLRNTNIANTKTVHEPNTYQACNNNKSNTITDELQIVKEIRDHNDMYEGTETIKSAYTTGTVSEGNIISQKSKSDEESNKLKIARQRLALLNMQNKDVQSDPLEDNSQKTVFDEYGSIISSVLKRVNILQTSYEVSFSKQEKSVDSCITSPNRVRSSADIKSLETRKRTIQNDREINKNSDSSKKRYRRAADTKQNNNYTRFSRPVQKPAAKTGLNLQRTAFAKNPEKYNGRQYLVPHHHYEQKKFVHKNTIRSFADIKSLRTRNRKMETDQVVTESVSRKAVHASKKPYRCGADIIQKNNYTHSPRPVQKSAPMHQTDVAKRKVKNNKIKKDTSSTSLDENLLSKFQIVFFRYEQERLMAKNLQKSANKLSCAIENLINMSENDDMEFECPKCHYASIYSPRLLYCKEDVHDLDESHKIVHCQSCIRFRKKYKKSFVRFFKENKTEFKKIKNVKTDDDTINSNGELITHAIEEQLNIQLIQAFNAITDDDIIKSNNEPKTQIAYTRSHSDSTHSADIRATDIPKIDTGSNQNIALKETDTINSNNELKAQSAYTRTDSDSIHITDIRTTDKPKIDTGSNQNIALIDVDTINSNNEFKTQIAYTRTHSDSIRSTDIGATDNRTKIDYEAIEKQLNMITNGVPSLPTKAKTDVQNKYGKIQLPVKLSCQMLKPSIVESLIKLKHKATIESINDIDEKNKSRVMNLEVQQIVSTKPATGISIPRNKSLKTAVKKNDGNTENNKECPVTIANVDNNRKNDAETTTNINAKLPKRNTNNSTDNAKNNAVSTCRVTQLINKDINAAKNINDDNKNKISSKVRKNLSIETATMSRGKIKTGTNNNNHQNCESRKNSDDTANRPDVEPKPKNSIGDVKNKYSANYRVSKAKKNNGISIKLTKITGDHDKVESRRNDKDEQNNKQGEDRKSSSDSGDSDSNEADDEINKTAKAIENSFKTLKNNCNCNKKSDLPKVHISGKQDKNSEPKNYATVKDEYTFKCHVCTSTFSYRRRYYNHMRNSHGIHNESIPERCIYKKCAICGSKKVQEKAYNAHIRTCHNTIYKIGAKIEQHKKKMC